MKMKKVLAALCLSACLTLGLSSVAFAAESPDGSAPKTVQTTNVNTASETESNTEPVTEETATQLTNERDSETETPENTESTEAETTSEPVTDATEPVTEPATPPATEAPIQPSTNAPKQADETEAVIEENGWHTVDGKTYYIQDGERLKGIIKEIDNNKYYFDANGIRVSGQVTIEGKQYYFDADGIMRFGFQTINGKKYFYNADGSMLIGSNAPQKINNTLYFVLSTGEIKLKSWNTYANKKYYSNPDGVLVTGLQTVDGKKYYFNGDGSLIIGKNSAMKINNAYYFVMTNGEIKTNGWNTAADKKKYYSNPDGTLVTKTVKKIGSKYYAFNVSMYKNCLKTIGGKRYLISSSGVVRTDRITTYKGKKYYSDKYGRIKTGVFKYKGKRYFANSKGQIRIGRFTDSGKSYYSNKKGQLYTGWVKYKNNYYYYNKSTGVMQNGWLKRGKSTYYLNSKGVRQTGWEKIKKKWYYFASNGKMLTGRRVLGGSTYYLDSKTGAMKTGWQKISGKYYYFNKSSGAMKKGWMNLGSKTYYLETDTGARRTGWLTYDAKKYYFNSKGVMLKGRQTVDGKVYNFGSSGGIDLLSTGTLTVKVNRAANTITVYADGEPIKAMLCSTGIQVGWTPLGDFTMLDKLRWHELDGPSWGQYCSHLTPEILFHSAPVTRYRDPNSLPAATYNQLGKPASHGCIRLTVADAKWLYDHCPIGTKVTIYDDASNPGPLGKPALQYMDANATHDPTDPLFH